MMQPPAMRLLLHLHIAEGEFFQISELDGGQYLVRYHAFHQVGVGEWESGDDYRVVGLDELGSWQDWFRVMCDQAHRRWEKAGSHVVSRWPIDQRDQGDEVGA